MSRAGKYLSNSLRGHVFQWRHFIRNPDTGEIYMSRNRHPLVYPLCIFAAVLLSDAGAGCGYMPRVDGHAMIKLEVNRQAHWPRQI